MKQTTRLLYTIQDKDLVRRRVDLEFQTMAQAIQFFRKHKDYGHPELYLEPFGPEELMGGVACAYCAEYPLNDRPLFHILDYKEEHVEGLSQMVVARVIRQLRSPEYVGPDDRAKAADMLELSLSTFEEGWAGHPRLQEVLEYTFLQ